MKTYRFADSRSRSRLLRALDSTGSDTAVEGAVRKILADVRRDGDAAILAYGRKFDGVSLTAGELRVSQDELTAAVRALSPQDRKMIRETIRAVKEFHREALPRGWSRRNLHGGWVGEKFDPIRRVGIYIPGGTVPLVSTVVMTTVPARLAGVPEIAVFTPPAAGTPGGRPANALLAALHLCKISEVYAIGGSQAIGAAAFGTRTVPAVDKVCGPGNAYVNEAKRQVFGVVGVDLLPGPSEVMIVADGGANPGWLAADLLAQAEHGSGMERLFLVTDQPRLVESVQREIRDQLRKLSHAGAIRKVLQNGFHIVLTDSLEQAVEVANLVAPEHLQLMVDGDQVRRLTDGIHTAGAILQGSATPTVLGDFVAGPSHTLPTGRSARYASGLRTTDFMRRTSLIRYDLASLRRAREGVEAFSRLEELDAHGRSLQVRLEGEE